MLLSLCTISLAGFSVAAALDMYEPLSTHGRLAARNAYIPPEAMERLAQNPSFEGFKFGGSHKSESSLQHSFKSEDSMKSQGSTESTSSGSSKTADPPHRKTGSKSKSCQKTCITTFVSATSLSSDVRPCAYVRLSGGLTILLPTEGTHAAGK